MNPIENVWGDMVKCLDGEKVKTKEDLLEKVRAVWEHFRVGRPEYWRKLAFSMVNRLNAVIAADGAWTKY